MWALNLYYPTLNLMYKADKGKFCLGDKGGQKTKQSWGKA